MVSVEPPPRASSILKSSKSILVLCLSAVTELRVSGCWTPDDRSDSCKGMQHWTDPVFWIRGDLHAVVGGRF